MWSPQCMIHGCSRATHRGLMRDKGWVVRGWKYHQKTTASAVCQNHTWNLQECHYHQCPNRIILYVLDYKLDRLIARNAQLGRTHLEKRDAPPLLSEDSMCSWSVSCSLKALVVKNAPANAEDIRDAGSIPSQEDPWRKAWQPTPAFLPGESHGQRSLVGCSP